MPTAGPRPRQGIVGVADPVPGDPGGQRVLVVDDVEEMRSLIHRGLSARGYLVDVASTLPEARDLRPGEYDAVLVDAQLGPEKGADLVEALRSEHPAAVRRCLIMTGGSADALPDGVAILAKPFQLDDLIDAVRALCQPAPVPLPGPPDTARQFGGHAAVSALPDEPHPDVPHAGTVEPRARHLLGLMRQLRVLERDEIADFVHDGPIQELAAATLGLQMLSRSMPVWPGNRCDSVLRQLHAAAASMRWLVDGRRHLSGAENGLAAAIEQRTAWLLAAPVTVDTADLPAPGGAEVLVIADVVELMVLALVPDGQPTRAHVAVRPQEHATRIELTLTRAAEDDQAIGDAAAARAALDGLAFALEASSSAAFGRQEWRAGIVLRTQPRSGTGAVAP
jgi:DNA-binding response OmpR family regulator